MQTDPAPAKSPFLLIFKDSGAAAYSHLTPEQREKLISDWYAWYDGLAAAGKLEGGRPLEAGGRVVSAEGGRIIDGPFAETKEVVGGYFYLTVSGLEEATKIARQCPALALGVPMKVEVRPVADMCPVKQADEAAKPARELVDA